MIEGVSCDAEPRSGGRWAGVLGGLSRFSGLGDEGFLSLDEAEGFLALGVPGVVLRVVVEPVSGSEDVVELSFDLV